MSGSSELGDLLAIRLPADPLSAAAARRFLADGLRAWDLTELADDSALVLTEMSSNATLHSGAQYFEVSIERLPGRGLRIAVADDGAVPAAAVVARPAPLLPAEDEDDPEEFITTGRGLLIISALSQQWGVQDTPTGKVVWADVGIGTGDHTESVQVAPEVAADDRPSSLPPGWHVVRLLDCPVALSLQQDDHLDELIRELQLVEADADDGRRPPAEIVALMSDVLGRQAHARHLGRRIAQDAAAAGRELITIDMPVPAEAATDVQRLHDAVTAADVLCERRRLLTLASSPELRGLRSWMVDEFVSQVEAGGEPCSWADWVAAHPRHD